MRHSLPSERLMMRVRCHQWTTFLRPCKLRPHPVLDQAPTVWVTSRGGVASQHWSSCTLSRYTYTVHLSITTIGAIRWAFSLASTMSLDGRHGIMSPTPR